jgi:hypothetical protein
LLKETGLLVFTGAGGIINNDNLNMIGYSLSKNTVHVLAK